MSLVIQYEEVEGIPDPPPDFPRCGSWPPANVKRHTAGVAAVMPDLDTTTVISESKQVGVSNSDPTNPLMTSGGINLGALPILLVSLLIIVFSAAVAMSVYIVRTKPSMTPETTHLL